MSGQISRQRWIRCSTLASFAGRFIAFSTEGRGMLEGDIEIREHQPLSHQGMT
jgi:hypothetical protein